MRKIETKYAGECKKCAAPLAVGTVVVYERRVGVFCVGCEPTTTEEIRAVRQEAADRKAAKYETWAEARERRANAYQARSDSLMGRTSSSDGRADWALVTQPGYIPQRAQANRAQERAWEEMQAANAHRAKAASVSHVVVKGDRERAREAIRAEVATWLTVGARIVDVIYGIGVVKRINKKNASCVRESDGVRFLSPLHWIKQA